MERPLPALWRQILENADCTEEVFPGSAGGYPLAHALEVLRHLLR
jgi:hypothetical protein